VSEQPPNQAAPEQATAPTAPEQAAMPAPSPPPMSTETGDQIALAERPEVKIGGAFLGGFALALLLKRLAR
jgi:hypothetical protein